jgi:hypothetical protein
MPGEAVIGMKICGAGTSTYCQSNKFGSGDLPDRGAPPSRMAGAVTD